MKITIISGKIGNGHIKASNTLSDYLTQRQIKHQIIETTRYFPGADGLFFGATKLGKLYNIIHWLSCKDFFASMNCNILFRKNKKIFLDDIRSFGTDIVITTVPFFYTWLQEIDDARIYTLITDAYTRHNSWIYKDIVSTYFVMDEWSRASFASHYPGQEFVTSFFPIEERFRRDKTTLGKRRFWFLLTDVNCRFVQRIVDALIEKFDDCVITIVQGRNKRGYAWLRQCFGDDDHVRFVEYVPLIEKYEEIDLFFGKPGGAIVSECIATDTPLIILNNLQGHEQGNIRMMEHYGVGKYLHSVREIMTYIQALDESILSIFGRLKKDACRVIYDHVM